MMIFSTTSVFVVSVGDGVEDIGVDGDVVWGDGFVFMGDGGGEEGDVLAVREGVVGGVGRSVLVPKSELVVSLREGWALGSLGEDGGDCTGEPPSLSNPICWLKVSKASCPSTTRISFG